MNMVSQNLPHEIFQYTLINMVYHYLPHGNLSIHINKYGIPEFTKCKFANTY